MKTASQRTATAQHLRGTHLPQHGNVPGTGIELLFPLGNNGSCPANSDLVQKGELKPEQIDSELISRHLTTHFMPDPDLLIRTGGELRLSNYMLWQCAYSELYFCDTYWPDFREEELRKAICDYQKRERRFGKTSEQIN